MMRRKLPPVTGAQFAALRESSGLSREDAEREWQLDLGEARRIEEGLAPVPKGLAPLVAWSAAHDERNRVLDASGLPACAEYKRLATVLATMEDDVDARSDHLATMDEHERRCPVCIARREYAKRHAPPVPDLLGGGPLTWLFKGARWLERAPRPFRVPAGSRGDGRRAGLFTAAAISLIPIALAVVMLLGSLFRHGFATGWWRDPLKLATIVPVAYLVGGFLTGWAWDLTKRIRFDFVRYVILGACAALFIYGAVALAVPFLDPSENFDDLATFMKLITALGAIGGAGYWAYIRVRAVLRRTFAR